SGGRVELRSKGFIETHGNRSHGLQAQSVGNGGGNSSTTKVSAEAPSAEAPNGDVRPEAVTVAVGIQGGQGGHGGDVELVAEGFIATHGESSHAVFAQSIGGGGGTGGSGNTFGITAARIGIALG